MSLPQLKKYKATFTLEIEFADHSLIQEDVVAAIQALSETEEAPVVLVQLFDDGVEVPMVVRKIDTEQITTHRNQQ